MIRLTYVVRGVLALSIALSSVTALAQQAAPESKPQGQTESQTEQKPFEPVSGQSGKDVVWVPTPQPTVDKMLELTKVTPKDYVIDLGSGDGITVITAAKKGATALGVEFNPDMVELARKRAAAAGVADKATFITLFLLPDINRRLRPKILDLAPGTRVASNTFDMGDWEPDAKETSTDCTQWCTALYWVVPAKVAGTWQLGGQTLTIEQKYQVVTGTLGSTPITGKLNGTDITFTAGNRTYAGKVNGTTINGSNWSATRKQAAAAR
jgi:hypothetical protein